MSNKEKGQAPLRDLAVTLDEMGVANIIGWQ